MLMNAPARFHVRWRDLSVKIPTDHLNVYATKDTSLFMIPKAIFNDVMVSPRFPFAHCLSDGRLGNCNLNSTRSSPYYFLSYPGPSSTCSFSRSRELTKLSLLKTYLQDIFFSYHLTQFHQSSP